MVLLAAAAAWVLLDQFYPVKDVSPRVAVTPDSTVSAPADTTPPDITSKNLTAENVTPTSLTVIPEAAALPAGLNIDVDPWAEVYIDDKHYGQTPLRQTIELKAGYHTIRLENNIYPDYTMRIHLKPGKTENLKINFPNLVGYLELKIEPWGRVYVNDVFKGESSQLKQPIALLPGRYKIKVENPSFGIQEKRIRISEQQTSTFELNFNSLK